MMRNGDPTTENSVECFQICGCVKGYGVPRKRRRVNGFQLPLHPQQIIGWITIAFTSLTTVFVVIPGLHPNVSHPIAYIMSALYVVHVFFNVITTLLDPAEDDVRNNEDRNVLPEFDRLKHRHVIENGRCHLCNITCSGPKTKHCSVCNKCVLNFDHHCKWLNHCIGQRNYVTFILSVVSAIALAILTLSIVIVEFVYYFTDPSLLTISSHHYNNTVNSANVSPEEVTFLTLAAFLGILGIIVAILLTHLYLFHLFIMRLGLTTYEYVRYQQEKNVVMIKEDSSECCQGHECKCRLRRTSSHTKHNGLELAMSKHDEIATVTNANNYEETRIDTLNDTHVFKNYSSDPSGQNLKRKQKNSLCHNQVDPINNNKQNTDLPLKEVILSPLPLKSLTSVSKYKSQSSNGKYADDNSNVNVNFLNNIISSKKVLSPILEVNNEINNLNI